MTDRERVIKGLQQHILTECDSCPYDKVHYNDKDYCYEAMCEEALNLILAGSETTSSIDHPSHYNVGKIEVIDAIHEWELDFNLGNVVKYVARSGHKEGSTALEDLKKARWYIDDTIRRLEDEETAD